MNPVWLASILTFFLFGPPMWITVYFVSDMYTQDKLMDMRDNGEITKEQYFNLYELTILGEYKLYPKIFTYKKNGLNLLCALGLHKWKMFAGDTIRECQRKDCRKMEELSYGAGGWVDSVELVYDSIPYRKNIKVEDVG